MVETVNRSRVKEALRELENILTNYQNADQFRAEVLQVVTIMRELATRIKVEDCGEEAREIFLRYEKALSDWRVIQESRR